MKIDGRPEVRVAALIKGSHQSPGFALHSFHRVEPQHPTLPYERFEARPVMPNATLYDDKSISGKVHRSFEIFISSHLQASSACSHFEHL